jgi:superfamily II DNA or RNA helicase
MIKLYDYQEIYISEIKKHFANGKKNIVLCSSTGSGKTIMFSYMTKQAFDKGKKILILTDRKELFGQSNGALVKMGLKCSLIKPNTKVDFSSSLYVGMVQTVMRRIGKVEYQEFLQSLDLIILDEAHKGIFDPIFEFVSSKTFVIGATATPHREGKQESLEKFYDEIVQVVDTPDLIRKGKLSPCKTYGVKVDLSGIKTKGGDYDEKSMGDKFSEIKLFHGVYENYMRICSGEKAIVFAPNVDSSRELVQDWKLKGLPVEHVDCYMSDLERKEKINWFINTQGAIISNYGILTTGFDVPNIEVVILYRATKSLPLFLQMAGRGSRLAEGKEHFTLLDFGNNVKTHNYWEHPRQWSLKKKEKKEGTAPIKHCPSCAFSMPAPKMTCPECGHQFEKSEREREEQIFAELVLLSGPEIVKLANKATISELIQIQKAKGYSKSWIFYYLKTAQDFIEYGKIMKYHHRWAIHQIQHRRL